jgi:M6 family metalloprotease-like protein
MFKRSILFIFVILAGFLFLAALPGSAVQASPASPVPFTVTQPDGTTFTAIQWGDEYANGLETVDGYSIAQITATGYWYYLTATQAGDLVPAQSTYGIMIVGRDSPAGLKKHLRPVESTASLSLPVSDEVTQAFAPSASGTHKVVVLLAGFPNATGRTDPSYWSNLIFGGAGSLKDYYESVSYDAMSIVPAAESSGTANDGIIGWLDLSPYYDAHPNPGSNRTDVNKYITKRALQVADAYINFADFDTNANGSISTEELHIIVVVAGFERSFGGTDEPAVWAHNSDLSGTVGAPTLDGKVVANASRGGYYSQVGEYHADHESTLGIIAHVFGHDLLWPELYDVDNSSYGVGDWSLMGTGAWNGILLAGDSPAYPSVWEKWYQGWLTPTTISGQSFGQTILRAEDNQSAFLLRPNTGAVDWTYQISSGLGEYFLVENRQPYSYDAALPGFGLLIWHIDETVTYDYTANANEARPLVKLIEADGLNELKTKLDRGDTGDVFPGSSYNRFFNPYSTPNSKLYNNTDSFVRVSNISDSAASMAADLLYGYPVAALTGLNPAYSIASSVGLTLKVYGSDFYSNSVVRWNGLDRTTYYISPTELHALITGLDMAALTAGPDHTADVTVFNPQPGGGESPIQEFAVIDMTTIVPGSFLSWVMNNYSVGPAYVIKKAEYFESPLAGWEILESGTDNYKWGRRNCRAYAGTQSAWAVGDGADGYNLACGSNYPNYANTSLAYGPFSTEGGIQNGEVKFRMFVNSESGFDYLWVLADIGGDTEHGYKVSGNSGGWIEGTLNLNNVDGLGFSVIGYPKVWFRFRFTSDYLVSTGEGAFVDDVILRVCYVSSCSGTYGPALAPLSISGSHDLLIEPVILDLEP